PALEALGVKDFFDAEKADLSGMATSSRGNIYISKVFQKTFIEVDTEGTRAAAVTEIVAADCAAMPMPDFKEVYLDRPFLYMIIDDATGVPVFMGTVTEL
ncbi:MAG: serpin, partial [Firmicutes bacterium]|nr:serpin [Bacillota bacterium]